MPAPRTDPTTDRIQRLQALLGLVQRIPEEWATEAKLKGHLRIQPKRCDNWHTLLNSWNKALKLRQELVDVITVMLAVALSTQQEGSSQLFLQVVGPPGTAKSTFCDALLVSQTCYALNHLTGFHSGSVDATGDDFSLVSRINGKTLVTSEGDVIMSSPMFRQIMAEQRRIFDGSSGATYKNRKEDKVYRGLRTPWIIAATPGIIESQDQSQLGDRFIRIRINQAPPIESRDIVKQAIRNSMASVKRTSNCEPETQLSPEKAEAYKLTGGYIDNFRERAAELIANVDQPYHLEDYYADLGEFTAFLRAGHQAGDKWKQPPDHEATVELPTRLGEQYARLGACIAAVLNKPIVDSEVLRLVKKVTIDSCRTRMLRLVEQVYNYGIADGAFAASLARYNGVTDDRMAETLRFLKEIKVVENFGGASADAHFRWRLTDHMRGLWEKVYLAF